ncbi:hypothetical protein PIB30_000786 [Stylosanthes scabra]|uniref:RRM domain-containing protein n=1 Tax=Stylosanthes scabra TaxID=79078 RepID=A0ABU6Q270_9FABA|nr:hypothetical protein [Stylosanthes scabra]
MRERERVGERKKSDGEGNANNQWRVVTRKKPNGHWRQGRQTLAQFQRRSTVSDRKTTTTGEICQGTWIEKNTFSFFVDNLPLDASIRWLWKVFSRFGRVKDIYLSRKVRKSNPLKFAFIRFRTKEDASRAIEQLDGWIVWGCKIALSESRFRRGNIGEGGSANEEAKENGFKGRQEGGGKVVKGRTTEGGKSYREALMNEGEATQNQQGDIYFKLQTLGDSKIYLEEKVETREKLKRCLIGESPNPVNFGELQQVVRQDCGTLEEVKLLGSMKMMMVFDTIQNLEATLEANILAKHFLEVRRWSCAEANRTRECWIEVSRLPLHGWTRENM